MRWMAQPRYQQCQPLVVVPLETLSKTERLATLMAQTQARMVEAAPVGSLIKNVRRKLQLARVRRQALVLRAGSRLLLLEM